VAVARDEAVHGVSVPRTAARITHGAGEMAGGWVILNDDA